MTSQSILDAYKMMRDVLIELYGEMVMYTSIEYLTDPFEVLAVRGGQVDREYVLSREVAAEAERWLLWHNDIAEGDFFVDSHGDRWDVLSSITDQVDGWSTVIAVRQYRPTKQRLRSKSSSK
jgi:hypothetical protein